MRAMAALSLNGYTNLSINHARGTRRIVAGRAPQSQSRSNAARLRSATRRSIRGHLGGILWVTHLSHGKTENCSILRTTSHSRCEASDAEFSVMRSFTMPRIRTAIAAALLSTFVGQTIAADKACFMPNGTDRNTLPDAKADSTGYVPCNQVGAFSMCCRFSGDTCMDNGLCQSYNADGKEIIWRESCTDRSWTSPECLNLCITGGDGKGNDCE